MAPYAGRVLDAATRLELVRPTGPAGPAGAVLAESWSNDTWLIDQPVLRVCWRGDLERLVRERLVRERPRVRFQ